MDGIQCKKCRYLLKDKEGYNWCPNKMDDPDLDLIRDCEWYAVRTNANRIRNMTDEELAKFMERTKFYVCKKVAEICGIYNLEEHWDKDGIVKEEIEWLKQEVSK